MRAAVVEARPIVAQRGLWPSIRRRVALIVVLLVWIGGVLALEWLVDQSPFEQAISLDPPGVIDTKIWIPLRERYFLEFEFSRQGHSLEQLKQLIGDWGPPETDGIPVAISWLLTSSNTRMVVAQGTAVTKGVAGWGDDVHRRVDAIRVEPGRYQFHAKILKPVPQLSSIPTRLKLWNTFKTRDTWQSSVLFWGTLFSVWIVAPVTMFLIARLIWLLGLRHRDSWRSEPR
jgi:hypothetical protein